MTVYSNYLIIGCMDEEPLDTMPQRVRFARKQAGFKSQAAIAKAIGVTREAYAWYETTNDIPSEHLPKFYKATGFNIHWIVTGEGPRTTDKKKALKEVLQETLRSYENDDLVRPSMQALLAALKQQKEEG